MVFPLLKKVLFFLFCRNDLSTITYSRKTDKNCIAQRTGPRQRAFHSLFWRQKCKYLDKVPKIKTLTLDCPFWRSPCCKGHRAEMLPLYFTGCWCHLAKMRQASHSQSIKASRLGDKSLPQLWGVFTNVMNASVSQHASLKISEAPGPQYKRLTHLYGSYYFLKRPQVYQAGTQSTFRRLNGNMTSPPPPLHLHTPQIKVVGWLPKPGDKDDLHIYNHSDTAQTPPDQPTYSTPRGKRKTAHKYDHPMKL